MATEREVNRFIALCHALASAFVQSKISTGRLHVQLVGLNYSDIAYDCIADLFQRDSAGSFVQLNAYFGGISIAETSDAQLLALLRRLVFSKVNQNIFRLYQEVDPALGKILRNLKIAITTLGNFIEHNRFGELCIAPSLCETLEHLPSLDATRLEQLLQSVSRPNDNVPTILAKLSLSVREQEEHSRIVPLLSVAWCIKSLYRTMKEESESPSSADSKLFLEDAITVIRETCESVKRENYPTYVHKKKIDVTVFSNYFVAIERNLVQTLLGGDQMDVSLYEHLKELLPELTKEEYRRKHKHVLEYLTRMTRERALSRLKKN
jgi:hypothetical protein